MYSYKQLCQVAKFRSDRISIDKVNKTNYITTDNMLPNRQGIEAAMSVPESKTVSKYISGDILLSNIRPYLKKIWYAHDVGGCSNDVLVVIPQNINPKFLYYVLSDNNFFNYATVTSKGTKMPRGTPNAIMKYLVPNVDITIQNRITGVLSAYDDLIENNNKRIEILDKMAGEIYKEWFVRFRFPGHENIKIVDGLPEGWNKIKLEKAVEIIDGDRGINYPKQDELLDEGFCLFLNAGNVTKRGFDYSSLVYITERHSDRLRKGKVKNKDVILTTRGTVGNVAFYDELTPFKHMRINSGMVIIRENGCLSTPFVYAMLCDDYLQETIRLYCSGSAQPQLPIKDMKRIKVIQPEKRVMKAFDDIAEDICHQISLYKSQNYNLLNQKDLLLSRLMSGKLSV